MCGIAGALDKTPDREGLLRIAEAMGARLIHRGPDDHGVYTADHAALAHTRLSIIDQSGQSHQPMTTSDGRYTIVFNGEIYNYRELRDSLGDARFRSSGDTEVLLRLYKREGGECVKKLRGMFAFAVWDEFEQQAFFARDPLGVKPLYYAINDGRLLFASEVRALAPHLKQRKLDPEGLEGFLLFGNVPEPETLLEGVKLLPAGSTMVWRQGELQAPTAYWRVQEAFHSGEPAPLSSVLRHSVRRHLVSDVPVGLFLSGGIDSTALLALASSESEEPLRTFCIGFESEDWNEASVARRVAEHFGSVHSEHIMTAKDGLECFQSYIHSVDQPSIDGLNTWCVARMAHEHGMKVVMSGLGGDELFCGYPSFRHTPRMARLHAMMPPFASRCLGGFLQKRSGDARARRLGDFFSSKGGIPEAWRAFRGLFTYREMTCLYKELIGGLPREAFPMPSMNGAAKDQVAHLEMVMYMRNQLLRDSDVMSMAHGLELRVPFVDAAVAEAVLSIPPKRRGAAGKALLLESVPGVPDYIANARKRGFRFPFAEWIRRDWDDVFDPVRERYGRIVPLDSWSRLFTLYVLDSWRETIGIDDP